MKHLLYLGPSGQQLWQKDKHGWRQATVLPAEPVWVVTDLAEESFAEIEMPRLFGRDRSTYLARQLASRFPDTPYRTVLAPPGGGGLMATLAPTRQIFLAVNNAERVDSELGHLPVTGIWPMSLLLAHFCHSRKLPPDLLVVMPVPDALRIVHLRNHTPALTRLAPVPNETGPQIEEIIRTKRYLENTRMIERGQPCPVLLLGPAERFASPLLAAQFLPVAPPSPWDRRAPEDWRWPLFDLALHSPAGQVAPIARRTDFLASRLRKVAITAAIIGFAAALWAASGNLQVIIDTLAQQERIRAENLKIQARLAEVEEKTARFGVDPELVKRAIALDHDEILSVPAFSESLSTLANSLSAVPDARLKLLEWQLLPANGAPCAKTDAPPASGETPAEGEQQERRIELRIELTQPENAGPREQAQRLRQISQQLGRITGLRLIQDPAGEIDRGILQSTASGTTSKPAVWCLSLPGNTTRPAPTSGKSGQ